MTTVNLSELIWWQEKTGMHRSQSLPMNMKLSSAKSIKRMNSLDGVYRVVPSTPRAPAATAAASNAVPDIVPIEPGGWMHITLQHSV
jgi:hypothetical protein